MQNSYREPIPLLGNLKLGSNGLWQTVVKFKDMLKLYTKKIN
jgi:hypothetical protein